MTNDADTAVGKSTPPTAFLIAANAFALMVYLIVASIGWMEPGLDDVPGTAGGGAVLWFFLAIPLLLFAFLANSVLLVWTLIRRYRTARWYFSCWAWPVIFCLWMLAVAFDFSRHGT